MKKLIAIILFAVIYQYAYSQNQVMQLMPKEIRDAYQNGTRSISGEPGVNYWQNGAEYNIEASLIADESKLTGKETVVYFNNSPDTLERIVVRLYQDVYKKGNARNWPLGANAMTEGIQVHFLKINGAEININDREKVYRSATNLSIGLNDPLAPGDSLVMEAGWEFEISKARPVRTGNYKNDRFFIAYWYPQIGVYDDIDGWDMVDYLGTVEFYNDFNNFNVTVTVPENYLVWATGKLQNEDELYDNQIIKRLDRARESDEVVNIITQDDWGNNEVLKSKGETTWNFKAEYVPDFSFASTRFDNWDGSSLVVDSSSGRSVFVDAVYTDSARTYQHAANWTRESVEYMSFQLPGYPFPYEHMTTFSNGRSGGGMETPMMANNGDPVSAPNAANTIFHEIAHTYFPFFMGTNERKYAWMDEGWAAFLPGGFSEMNFPDYPYAKRGVKAFEGINGLEREASLMTLSYSIAGYGSYRVHAYVRSSLAYHFLQDALGEEVFKKALHAYIERWNGKHPLPYDFFNTFVNVSGQPLLWFIKPWFFDRAVADQGIKKVTMDNKIVVENVGGLPLPIAVVCEYEDNTTEIFRESTNIWALGEPAIIIQANSDKKISKVILGSDRIPDVNRENNEISPKYD